MTAIKTTPKDKNLSQQNNITSSPYLYSRYEEKHRIQGKSNNNLWFYLLFKKSYFARKHSLKKRVYSITFYLQFLCVAGYLKRSNDTLELI